LCSIGELLCSSTSTWLSTFLIPKKDGRVCWTSDNQKLSKHIEHKVNNLPKIWDIWTHQSGWSGYKYFTKLDISRQYYTFEFDAFNEKLCTNLHIVWYCYHQGVSQIEDHSMKLIYAYVYQLHWSFLEQLHSHCHSLLKTLNVLAIVNPYKRAWAVSSWLARLLANFYRFKPWKKEKSSNSCNAATGNC
jgi:hypothetical protein